MKILVPLKRVPDPDTKIRVHADGSGLDVAGVKFAINPFDAIALEEALRLRDQQGTADILVVSLGSADCQEQLRAGLAMGADRALLVRYDEPVDSLAIAKILAAIARREQPDIVLMGKQAIDDDANQAGQMLAGLLGFGQATFISKLSLNADAKTATSSRPLRVTCSRETDAGLETVTVTLPAILTTDLRLNEPRYVTALGIMKAKKKPLSEISVEELGFVPSSQSSPGPVSGSSDKPPVAARTRVLKLAPAPRRKAGVRVKTVDELLQKLREEARVISR